MATKERPLKRTGMVAECMRGYVPLENKLSMSGERVMDVLTACDRG